MNWKFMYCNESFINLSKKHFMFLEKLVSVYLVNLNFLGCFKISKFHVKIRIGITICKM